MSCPYEYINLRFHFMNRSSELMLHGGKNLGYWSLMVIRMIVSVFGSHYEQTNIVSQYVETSQCTRFGDKMMMRRFISCPSCSVMFV